MKGAIITALALFVFLWVMVVNHPGNTQSKVEDETYIRTVTDYNCCRYEKYLGPEVIREEIPELPYTCEYTDAEIAIFHRTGMSEAGTLCVEAIQAVTQVQMNRAKSDYQEFANYNTIHDVVYGKAKQFSTADNGEPNEKVIFAVECAIMNPEAFPLDMLWFNSDHWPAYGHPYTVIDGMYFSTVTNYNEEVEE